MHPDMQEASIELVGQLVDPAKVFTRLPQGFENALPAVLIDAANDDSEIFPEHTVAFEVYHDDVVLARKLARVIVAHLSSGQHGTEAGLIDEMWVDVKPKEVPYVENVALVTFTMKAATRPV